MKIYLLEREQRLRVTLEEAWRFFSTPKNLDSITPPELGFQIVRGGDDPMHEGQVIEYRVRVVPGIWLGWVTEIRAVDEGFSFVDEQRFGPYRFWHHRHAFESVAGGVKMTDRVHYALPFGWFGRLAHALFVRAKLERIFAFRAEVLERRFGRVGGDG